MNIEPLESRIAPASVIQFTDVDGDLVKVTSSLGDLTGKAIFDNAGPNQQLQLLNLTSVEFQGATISTSVTKAPGGDGLVNIGRINATGRDLASVTVKGDLAQIDVGDNDTSVASPALKTLSVRSMGLYGVATGALDLQSDIHGALGTLKVTSDIKEASISVSGGAGGTIGSATIGGSLVGGAVQSSGRISSEGIMGPVKIGRDLIGGDGQNSGQLFSTVKITSVTIGGSMLGGTDTGAGTIDSTELGAMKIGGDLLGGTGGISGRIVSVGNLGPVAIGGSLKGGAGPLSGQVFSGADLGAVTIGRDVIGGGADSSGQISANATLASLSIAGSLIGGNGPDSGKIFADAIGTVKIGRDLVGAFGIRSGLVQADDTIASVSVAGSVVGGTGILAGRVATTNADLGPVKIGRDLIGGAGEDSGTVAAELGKLTDVSVGGSLAGGLGDGSGVIFSKGEMGLATVGHDLLGGGNNAGRISSEAKILGVKIGGDLRGGAGNGSGGVGGGDIDMVEIGGDLVGGSSQSSGGIGGGVLGHVTIGGSVIGSAAFTATIFGNTGVGPVKIGGDLIGGEGQDSAKITSNMGALDSLTIGGSVIGGAGSNTGRIVAATDIGAVSIRGDVIGREGVNSGSIRAGGQLTSLTIGGSLLGGTANGAGQILSVGDMGAVKIGRDLRGGSLVGGGPTLDRTGNIEADRIASVTIGGSIIAGRDPDTGDANLLLRNATIRAFDDIGPVVIKGSIIGNSTSQSSPVLQARGQETLAPGATSDLAIASITVGGRVEWALILAGFTPDQAKTVGQNGNASIGAVKVGGDWIASSISAGVEDGNGDGYANGNDMRIAGATLVARIASITIKGVVAGTGGATPDHFGFVAAEIGSFKSLGFTAPLPAGPSNDFIQLSPTTDDVAIREI